MADEDLATRMEDREPVSLTPEPADSGIVHLPDSFGLDLFPSEAPAPALAVAASEPVAQPVARDATPPVIELPASAAAIPAPVFGPPRREPAVDPREQPIAFTTPARDLEVPTRLLAVPAQAPPPDLAPEDTTPGMTLSELINRNGGLDWREAVAVVHALCRRLRADGRPLVQLEPQHVEVTAAGGVRLLPGPSSDEAVVIQLGRLLRAMLMGRSVPPELRLLLSQATFEVPILHSIDDIDRKLREFCRVDPRQELRTAYSRASAPALPRVEWADASPAGLPTRPILPAPSRRRRLILSREFWRTDSTPRDGLLVAALVVGLAVLAGLTWGRFAPAAEAPSAASLPVAAASSGHGAVGSVGLAPPASPAPSGSGGAAVEAPRQAPPGRVRPESPAAATRPPARASSPAEGRVDASELSMTVGGASRPAPASPSGSARETERRAARLVAEGQAAEASMAFDALVLGSPLYEPSRQQLTPEAYATFQASRRSLLPMIAQREYDRGRSALDSGNVERALASGNLALAVIDRIEASPPEALRERATELVEQATIAALSADDVIYTTASPGIVPPRPLSRQFPLTGPPEVPPHRVGSLEMIVGKQGEVEFVKLHTPLNRYHERMVVSAAKAWRYRPATKGGRPVRFRLTVRINLPESGTDPY